MATSTVTIDKGYFETLLRRAQFHTSGIDFSTPANLPMVTIPKVDHDNLLRISREYANLRRNLINGGVNYDTLAILTVDPPAGDQIEATTNLTTGDTISDTGEFLSQNPQPFSQSTFRSPARSQAYNHGHNDTGSPLDGGYGLNGFNNQNVAYDDFTVMPEGHNIGMYGTIKNTIEQGRSTQFQKNAKRSVNLGNLPENVTHGDIAAVVRGGMLLDLYVRDNDRSAVVSFLNEEDALNFFRNAKRNDLYIGGKRVQIGWNERQFVLPGHIAHKIAIGATRNLVVRGINQSFTELSIRNDLDHIHNLVVIKVSFERGDVHISTNSVHNALFARTCMMSRAIYKGLKIEWEADECADPIQKLQPPVRDEQKKSKKKKSSNMINRFGVLNVEDGEDDDHDISNSTLQTVSAITTPVVA